MPLSLVAEDGMNPRDEALTLLTWVVQPDDNTGRGDGLKIS
jgi:hypothetical protein